LWSREISKVLTRINRNFRMLG